MGVPKSYKFLFVVAKSHSEMWEILTDHLKKCPNAEIQYDACRIYCKDHQGQSFSLTAKFCPYSQITFLGLESLDQIFLWSSGLSTRVDVLVLSKDERFVQSIKDKYTYKREGIQSVELSEILTPSTDYDL